MRDADEQGKPFDCFGPYGPPGEGGESIVAGQVAMATDCSGRLTMPTGNAGALIGRRPSGLRAEPGTESWTVLLLHGAVRGKSGVDKGGKDGEKQWKVRREL